MSPYAGSLPILSTSQQEALTCHQSHGAITDLTVIPAVSHDPVKVSSTKGINLSLQVGVQCPCLTPKKLDRNYQQLEDLNVLSVYTGTNNAKYSC